MIRKMKGYSFLFSVGILMVTYIMLGQNIFWTGIALMIIGFVYALIVDDDNDVKKPRFNIKWKYENK